MIEQFLIYPKERVFEFEKVQFENFVVNAKLVRSISKPTNPVIKGLHAIVFYFDGESCQYWHFRNEDERNACFSKILALFGHEM